MPVPDPLHVRCAEERDLDAVVALVNSAYRGESSRLGWTTEADLVAGQRIDKELLGSMLSVPGSVVLLHELDRCIVGSVHLERCGDEAHLGMLAIRPGLQATGLGRRMLLAAEAFVVREWRSAAIRMLVLEQRKELIAWYERRGYVRTGERERFPYGEQRVGVPLRPDLSFEVLRKLFSA